MPAEIRERPAVEIDNWSRPGTMFLDENDNLLVHLTEGPPLTAEVPSRHVERVKHLVRLRDATRRVLHSELANAPKDEQDRLRTRLGEIYDTFAATYGPVNQELVSGTRVKRVNLQHFESDPDAALVAALEVVDIENQIYSKASIFTENVLRNVVTTTRVETPADALAVSLDRKARVDIPFMAELLGKGEGTVIEDLAGDIYENPETGQFEIASQYLSGPVRKKLALAKERLKDEPKWKSNVQALELVQPIDLTPNDISAALGAPWIPPEDVSLFITSLLGGKPEEILVSFDEISATWTIRSQRWDHRYGPTATGKWGTQRRNTLDLVESALNQRDVQVKDPIANTDPVKYRVNQDETLAAKDKLSTIKEEFSRWIWADKKRAERLSRDYNDRYNDIREMEYDGSHLTFPGMSAAVELRQHQKDAIWRALQSGNTLLAHEVGTGKAQPLDALILTPSGWVRMGDIKAGDTVVAGDGTPTRVLGVYPQGEKEIYEVETSDGARTECCDEHLWLTRTYKERNAGATEQKLGKDWPSAKAKVRQLSEIRGTLVAPHLNAKNHSIPVVEAVMFEPQATGLDPYLMGALLGDGCTRGDTPHISNSDEEVLAFAEAAMPAGTDLKPRTGNNGYDFALVGQQAGRGHNPVTNALRQSQAYGMLSAEKFIPTEYKFNSIDTRIALLQGLMDTDGTVSRDGFEVSFTTVSRRLADDVTFLVRSLGGVSGESSRYPKYTYKGEKRTGQLAYTLSIALPADISPFRKTDKGDLVTPKTKYRPARYITKVTPVGRKEAQCIAVEHPSHLYVTDDFIVTHNTFCEASIAVESRRLGMAKKPCIIVPNHMIEQVSRDVLQLYPLAKILVGGRDDVTPAARKHFAARVATTDCDLVLMTHNAFGRIPISRAFERQIVQEEIADLRLAMPAQPGPIREYEPIRYAKAANENREIEERRSLYARAIRQLEKKLEKLGEGRGNEEGGVTFEELGIDLLIVDESDAFKALTIESKNSIRGNQGSKRADDLYLRARYLDHLTPGRGVVFATGTPISNSIAELYVLQRYLQRQRLKEAGILHYDAWCAMFGESVTTFELAPGGGYRIATRFASFKNIPELSAMFREVADVRTTAELKLPVPEVDGGGPEDIAVAPTPEQQMYLQHLVDRSEDVKGRRVRADEDNMLKVVNDGRKAALDIRLIDPSAPDDPTSKLSIAAVHIADMWKETASKRLTQVVFCDISTPKPGHFNIYDELKAKLVELGVNPDEIAFAQDAKSDRAKHRLFSAVNRGQVRVLIASTETAGVGTNIQERLRGLTHLDAAWRPRDMQQRQGRIVRQGNTNPNVSIRRYVTEKSFDAYMYQGLERKARFIAQVLSGDKSLRIVEDVDAVTLSFATIKAIATGDPNVKRKAELENEVARLTRLVRAEELQNMRASKEIGELPAQIDRLESRVRNGLKDLEERVTTEGKDFLFTTEDGKEITEREAAGKILRHAMDVTESMAAYGTGQAMAGTLGGFDIGFEKYRHLGMEMYARKNGRYYVAIPFEARSPSGLIRRAEGLLNNLDVRVGDIKVELDRAYIKKDQLRAYAEGEAGQKPKLDAALKELEAMDRKLGIHEDDLQAAVGGETVDEGAEQPAARPLPRNRRQLAAADPQRGRAIDNPPNLALARAAARRKVAAPKL